MHLILLGPPGAGKGTQAKLLAERYHAVHISTGDIFRAAIKDGTALGLKAKSFLDSGGLVPDEIVIGIVTDRLSRGDCREGFLLDGFPRTLPQADALDHYLKEQGRPLTVVLDLEVPSDLLLRRLTGRRICRHCGTPYHMETKPPVHPGRCDQCQGEVYQRDDDKPETVAERLRVYAEQTQPLIEYYGQQGALIAINATGSIKEVDFLVEQALETLGKK